ncbi:hypothetical protein ACOZ17_000522 [Cronobacter sakazakii]|nr:hypothetical protein [Cronobacter sakazakii]
MATDLITTQLITVGGTIGGALLTGIVTIISQYINKKSKENEIKQQITLKIIEENLKERKLLIKPILQFIDSFNLPEHHEFYDDSGEWLERAMISSYIKIKKEISNFMLNYTVYMNDEIRNSIWDLSTAINKLTELESKLRNASNNYEVSDDIIYMSCKDEPSKIWSKLQKLRGVLCDEINIIEVI